jgi:hypothetical protein
MLFLSLASLVVAVVALAVSIRALAHGRRQADATELQANLAMPPRLRITPDDHQYGAFLDHRGGARC